MPRITKVVSFYTNRPLAVNTFSHNETGSPSRSRRRYREKAACPGPGERWQGLPLRRLVPTIAFKGRLFLSFLQENPMFEKVHFPDSAANLFFFSQDVFQVNLFPILPDDGGVLHQKLLPCRF
jgi:hypothetical protein